MPVTCDGFYNGTSGSPWLTHFNGTTGNVIATLGGSNGRGPDGPHYDRYSYSPLLTDAAFSLYQQATDTCAAPRNAVSGTIRTAPHPNGGRRIGMIVSSR